MQGDVRRASNRRPLHTIPWHTRLHDLLYIPPLRAIRKTIENAMKVTMASRRKPAAEAAPPAAADALRRALTLLTAFLVVPPLAILLAALFAVPVPDVFGSLQLTVVSPNP